MTLIPQPRLTLGLSMTPVEALPRLSAALGGAEICVKRDDMTGFALGGNKVRKLEYLLADALAQGADTVVTMGGIQSNHCRQTAAGAAKLGLKCELVLTEGAISSTEFDKGGNVLLDRLAGARLHFVGNPPDRPAAMAEIVEAARARGAKPYAIPVGGSSALGSLGYVRVVEELAAQLDLAGLAAIVTTTGSAGTHAGLAAGLAALGAPCRLIGISVSQPAEPTAQKVADLAAEVLRLIGRPEVAVPQIEVRDAFIGSAYGHTTEAGLEAIRLSATLEGMYLDPVYTGKAMAGLIAAVRGGEFGTGQKVLFLHTGGATALFAYRAELGLEG